MNSAGNLLQLFFFNLNGDQAHHGAFNLGDFGAFGGAFGHGANQGGKRKGATVRCLVGVTLEKLYRGRTKTMRITRKQLSSDGQSVRTESKTLAIEIQRGWKASTRARAARTCVWRWATYSLSSQKPHAMFERKGGDLAKTVAITLDQSAQAQGVRHAQDYLAELWAPRARRWTFARRKAQRCDLLLRFRIQFPEMLDEQQKEPISRCLLVSAFCVDFVCSFSIGRACAETPYGFVHYTLRMCIVFCLIYMFSSADADACALAFSSADRPGPYYS